MKSSGRGVDKAELDHYEWLEDDAASERRAAERRGRERRAAASASPSRERRSRERRAAERRAPRPRSEGQPRQTSQRRRVSSAPGLAPGVAESRALILVTALLLLYGLVMAYSASVAQAYFQHGSSFYFVQRQLMWAVLGLAVMWALSRIDYGWYRRLAVPLALLALAGLAAVLVPGVGASINGARRWLFIGGQGLQPSEFAKLAAVVLVAAMVSAPSGEVATPKGFARLAIVGILPAAVSSCSSPTSGPRWSWSPPSSPCSSPAAPSFVTCSRSPPRAVVLVLGLIVIEPYRLQRLTTFLDPWQDPQGSGFQATQSLISIASGRIFGVGLGNSVQKFGYLPEQGTDMITGIIGEELGLIGLVPAARALRGARVGVLSHRARLQGAVRQAAGDRHHGDHRRPGVHQHRAPRSACCR